MKVELRTAGIGGGLYARAGEATFCARGHLLGTFARDVFMGANAEPGDLILSQGSAIGMPDCPECKFPVGESIGFHDPELTAPGNCYYFLAPEGGI